MKSLMILGGLLGLVIGMSCGMAQDVSWPVILWRSSLSAFLGGLLFRWWGRICMQGLEQAHAERMALAAKLEAQKAQSRDKS